MEKLKHIFNYRVENNYYYNILGVESNVSIEEITRKYKRIAMHHHPDRGGDTEYFAEITQAFNTLKDPKTRRIYDVEGCDGLKNMNANRRLRTKIISSIKYGRYDHYSLLQVLGIFAVFFTCSSGILNGRPIGSVYSTMINNTFFPLEYLEMISVTSIVNKLYVNKGDILSQPKVSDEVSGSLRPFNKSDEIQLYNENMLSQNEDNYSAISIEDDYLYCPHNQKNVYGNTDLETQTVKITNEENMYLPKWQFLTVLRALQSNIVTPRVPAPVNFENPPYKEKQLKTVETILKDAETDETLLLSENQLQRLVLLKTLKVLELTEGLIKNLS